MSQRGSSKTPNTSGTNREEYRTTLSDESFDALIRSLLLTPENDNYVQSDAAHPIAQSESLISSTESGQGDGRDLQPGVMRQVVSGTTNEEQTISSSTQNLESRVSTAGHSQDFSWRSQGGTYAYTSDPSTSSFGSLTDGSRIPMEKLDIELPSCSSQSYVNYPKWWGTGRSSMEEGISPQGFILDNCPTTSTNNYPNTLASTGYLPTQGNSLSSENLSSQESISRTAKTERTSSTHSCTSSWSSLDNGGGRPFHSKSTSSWTPNHTNYMDYDTSSWSSLNDGRLQVNTAPQLVSHDATIQSDSFCSSTSPEFSGNLRHLNAESSSQNGSPLWSRTHSRFCSENFTSPFHTHRHPCDRFEQGWAPWTSVENEWKQPIVFSQQTSFPPTSGSKFPHPPPFNSNRLFLHPNHNNQRSSPIESENKFIPRHRQMSTFVEKPYNSPTSSAPGRYVDPSSCRWPLLSDRSDASCTNLKDSLPHTKIPPLQTANAVSNFRKFLDRQGYINLQRNSALQGTRNCRQTWTKNLENSLMSGVLSQKSSAWTPPNEKCVVGTLACETETMRTNPEAGRRWSPAPGCKMHINNSISGKTAKNENCGLKTNSTLKNKMQAMDTPGAGGSKLKEERWTTEEKKAFDVGTTPYNPPHIQAVRTDSPPWYELLSGNYVSNFFSTSASPLSEQNSTLDISRSDNSVLSNLASICVDSETSSWTPPSTAAANDSSPSWSRAPGSQRSSGKAKTSNKQTKNLDSTGMLHEPGLTPEPKISFCRLPRSPESKLNLWTAPRPNGGIELTNSSTPGWSPLRPTIWSPTAEDYLNIFHRLPPEDLKF